MPASDVLNVDGFDAALHQHTLDSKILPALEIDLDKLVHVECCVVVPQTIVRGVGAGSRSRI